MKSVFPCAAALATLLAAPWALFAEETERHWSFFPPVRHDPPRVLNPGWVTGPIDAFILHRLEEAGLKPNTPAPPRPLLRRLAFDLTGLPPAEAQPAGEPNPAEFVDALLASPQFGARWARLWLDVARYAEDQAHVVGNNQELFYPNAYLYRDWIIDAFNRDLPYDEFIVRQLAADLIAEESGRLSEESKSETNAELAALGFIGIGPKYYRRSDPTVMADEWEDRVDTVSRGLLGLTVSCARCHDHKYDPIPTEDYYALAGVFASTEMFNRPLDSKREAADNGEAKNPAEALHIIRDLDEPVDLAVHIRGSVDDLGPEVPRRFLSALTSGNPKPFTRASGRLELAKSIASRDNPLTARVFVNRVWAELFGRSLVETPSNFGVLGAAPSHPELLDDLAVRFMENGWSLKWLVREIVLSSTYRQSSELTAEKKAQDPGNRLYGRATRRRLDVEMWRDAIYTAAGTLDPAIGGPSFEASDPDANRRAIHARISRLKLDPMLALFDFPDPNLHSPGRHASTTPLQKLFAMNNPLMIRQAEALVDRLRRESPESDISRVRRAYRLLYGRPATGAEEDLAVAFLGDDGVENAVKWQEYAQVLLASNELLYLD